MTQEERLLLIDLCARLPHGVMCEFCLSDGSKVNGLLDTETISVLLNNEELNGETVKPYLRPLSSITEEEKHDLIREFWGSHTILDGIEEVDWYLQRHFDIRNLIEKGLALSAPDGMYDIK